MYSVYIRCWPTLHKAHTCSPPENGNLVGVLDDILLILAVIAHYLRQTG
jgi:hypothetical protein